MCEHEQACAQVADKLEINCKKFELTVYNLKLILPNKPLTSVYLQLTVSEIFLFVLAFSVSIAGAAQFRFVCPLKDTEFARMCLKHLSTATVSQPCINFEYASISHRI
jgi:hypothetical protein